MGTRTANANAEKRCAEVQVFAAANPPRIENTYNAQFERRFNEPRKATLHTILLRSDIEGVAPEAVKERQRLFREDWKKQMAEDAMVRGEGAAPSSTTMDITAKIEQLQQEACSRRERLKGGGGTGARTVGGCQR